MGTVVMAQQITGDERAVADRLFGAIRDSTPIDPVQDVLGRDLDSAYRVQELVMTEHERMGAARIGRKVGLTSPAVQKQLGVDQPDFGVLLSTMLIEDGGEIPVSEMIAPRIEAELAFGIGSAIDLADGIEGVRKAIAWVAPALEIVDSRIRDWKITITDTVADNASSAFFVLGAARLPLGQIDTVGVQMQLRQDGEQVSGGTGAACLGDPVLAVEWVARTAEALGRPLQPGEVVMSGALGPMVPLAAGKEYAASISGLGDVTVKGAGA